MAQFVPGYRSMLATASSIVSDSRSVMRGLPRTARKRTRLMPTPWVASNELCARPLQPTEGPLRLLFAGDLTTENGIDLVLETVAPLVNAGKVTLDIVGDGPLAGWLHHTVIRDGLDGVRLHIDELSRAEMPKWHDRSDLLVAVGSLCWTHQRLPIPLILQLSDERYTSRVCQLETRLDALADADYDEPHARRIGKRLRKYRKELTAFLWEKNLEGTNNTAGESKGSGVFVGRIKDSRPF